MGLFNSTLRGDLKTHMLSRRTTTAKKIKTKESDQHSMWKIQRGEKYADSYQRNGSFRRAHTHSSAALQAFPPIYLAELH
jgi:hypothetical protein